MVSFVTSFLNARQQAGAVTNATKEQVEAAMKAAGLVDAATGQVNQDILASTLDAINGYTGTAEQAATGVEGATAAAQQGATTAAENANQRLQPYIGAGEEATASLLELIRNPQKFSAADLENDEGVRFRQEEQQRAIERSAAAKGGSMGGGTLKALAQYGQRLASEEVNNAYQRFDRDRTVHRSTLTGLAGTGLQASDAAGRNTIGAAQYSGNAGMTGARVAGGMRMDGARYAGDSWMDATRTTGANTLNAAGYRADRELDAGSARAAGHIGRSNAWAGAWNQAGRTGDAMLSGGFGGKSGFSLRGMARGY